MDLLIKVWPLLAGGAAGFAVVVGLLWRISAGIATVVGKIDRHNEAICDLKDDVKELDRQSRAHSTAIAALEATQ